MIILFFSRLFYPHIGGVEKHVLEISKILVQRGNKVTVFTEKFSKEMKDKESVHRIQVIRIDVGGEDWFKKFRIWRQLWNHRNLIRSADIVHCHDVFFWYLPFRFLYPSKKIFVTFHGHEGNKIPGFKSKLMHKIAEKLSKGNICVGNFLKKWYGTKPNYVTYGAVSKIKNSKFKIQNYNSKFKILFLGRLEEETGIMEYLRALLILKNKGRKFELTILGDGKLRRKAENFSRVNKINAQFKGFVGNTQDYLKKCDFVLTSRYLGILEALVSKRFVSAHYNNSIKKDYLEMTPFAKFIIIEDNPQEIANKIEYYLKHKRQAEEKVNQGFEWVKDKTWNKTVNAYLKLWGYPRA